MAKVEKNQVDGPVVERDDRFDDTEGRYAQIQTRGRVVGGGCIFYRAHIIKVSENAITVSFYGKPEKKKDETTSGDSKPELKTEIIKKIDVVRFRLLDS